MRRRQLTGIDIGPYQRPVKNLLARALWGMGLGIVGTGLGTSLVSALVTKPFGRFWGTTAGFATYTSGLGIIAYLAASYVKEGVALAKEIGAQVGDELEGSALIDKVRGDVVVGKLTRVERIQAQTQGRQEARAGGKVNCRPPCGFDRLKEGAWNATCLVEAGLPGEGATLLMQGWKPGAVPPPEWVGWQREGWRAQGCGAPALPEPAPAAPVSGYRGSYVWG